MVNFRNLNTDVETSTQTLRGHGQGGQNFGMQGKVLTQGMCMPNIKGVIQLI